MPVALRPGERWSLDLVSDPFGASRKFRILAVNGVQIFVATKPVDFRKGHDGLAALVQGHLKKKPFDGAVYVFQAKQADRLKMIWWDGTGLVMAYTLNIIQTHTDAYQRGPV